MKKRVTKSFLVPDGDMNGGFYCIRGRTLREAVRNALTPRGDFRGYLASGATVDSMMDLLLGRPIFESEAWIWPVEWNEEERKRAMKH
ncbi:MAG: hypothetical protein ABFD50_15455 [Smithella sp.]